MSSKVRHVDASSESSGESVHWSLRCFKCDKYQISRFFLSRLTQAAKTQAGLCIGISSTEPSFLENAITVHCEIFQIKHWNISIKGNKNLFSKKVVTGNTQSEHLFRACTACPDTKIKILNHGPREP